jgi:excisionase family DNA binding protein
MPALALSPLKRWLNQAEAAEYLGVTDRTIRNYIRTGALTGRRLPGSRLIRLDRHELDAALRPVPSARPIGGESAGAVADA